MVLAILLTIFIHTNKQTNIYSQIQRKHTHTHTHYYTYYPRVKAIYIKTDFILATHTRTQAKSKYVPSSMNKK